MSVSPQVVTLKNSNGLQTQISNLGATILNLMVPDKNQNLVNVVVGLKDEQEYVSDNYIEKGLYLGTTVGRWAGRITNGKFKIGEEQFNLYSENGVHLHGGKEGFDKKYWNIDKVSQSLVKLSYLSKDLEEGFPGNLKVTVTYELTDSNELKIDYRATTDKITPVNLTNHAYFNLDGEGSILNHQLEIKSDKYVELDEKLLVTGKLIETKNTSYDFNIKSEIGKRNFKGLDDIFILSANNNTHSVSLSSPNTGIEMSVITNQPTLVIYTPVQLPELPYKDNVSFTKFSAICFEAEGYPDAVNQPEFPSALLSPNETYHNKIVFKFLVK
ncbi:galactose mutarotase [Aureibaculum marinum]|uniref:Aldose 1-epimerase n=1 Tax=Aureibaculum marinum TaxID=2487930 RepID=A0A3N4NKU8_9FLAO|nr:aldose epimerase family protein [Aureibaculum marinum]RPD96155.1 galactose mutarotase [Aureibaculum marinum]